MPAESVARGGRRSGARRPPGDEDVVDRRRSRHAAPARNASHGLERGRLAGVGGWPDARAPLPARLLLGPRHVLARLGSDRRRRHRRRRPRDGRLIEDGQEVSTAMLEPGQLVGLGAPATQPAAARPPPTCRLSGARRRCVRGHGAVAGRQREVAKSSRVVWSDDRDAGCVEGRGAYLPFETS
jgi:hypothetical protein